ncbi:hypothetical protein [Haloferula sp. A504]|uniref:hypothetical protein n=1 Tax=Haloferula sp. A504 TaxID=3373601 RepID=UPI0031CA184E|nr:hypothetical protein [Verrucomicrobiaceae bacterium E54]
MANRIESAVVRGEIDNTVEGRTIGWIWLLGRADPVTLDLAGDCWRDLAGARLKFRNPEATGHAQLDDLQRGVVGDMTASRKCRVPLIPIDDYLEAKAAGEDPGEVWKNTLYLEWFSESDGRVVIETTDYELELSDPEWRMDADAEEAQKLANLQAMRDFLERIIDRRPFQPDRPEGVEDDEFEWEKRLKESDRLTDAYQEVLEKYMNDPDAERKEAFAMGWDGMLEAMADKQEQSDPEDEEDDDEEGWMECDDDMDFGDREDEHPLIQEAEDLAVRAFTTLDRESEAAAEVASLIGQVAAKLAGALCGDYEREIGFVLALLKRCLSLQNEALAAFNTLLEQTPEADRRRAIEALRDDFHLLRGKTSEMRRELRGT